MPNYTKTIYDKITLLIKTAYPRFTDAERIRVIANTGNIELDDLAYDDFILIKILPSETLTPLTAGKISEYKFILTYIKKLYLETADDLSDFAEKLDQIFLDNVYNDGYWTGLETTIDYDVEINTSDDGVYLEGFNIEITLTNYKSST